MNRPDHESSQRTGQFPLFLCCWCDVVFRNGERAVGHAENYGICPNCLGKALSDLESDSSKRSSPPVRRAGGNSRGSSVARG